MSFDCDLCHFFTCSLPSFNDMSKHSLVLWVLLLLLWVGGGRGGGSCYVLFENDGVFFLFFCFLFFWGDGKSVMSVICSYYYMCMFV